MQSINCQADVFDIERADSLFQQRSYKEAMEIYQENYQLGIYSPAMLLKMSFISEGIGDKELATLYLSKYYDLNPNSQTISKIKNLTGQSNLVGYEVSDTERFILFLVEYKEIMVGALAVFLVISLIMLWVNGRKVSEARYYWPSIFLIILIFITNNFLKAPRTALITQSPTMIVSKPSAGGELVDRVEPGHRVKIRSSKDIWYEVEWKNQTAFIKKDNVTTL
ncbi:SH3 domain-containing protein [Algoriphagus sp. SE2]|uniref:SH3 domain-containing protein n=1 Tax=Algoriphagus sp. SE2 TaxID=3141536 RepID=UPI0031CCE125